MQSFTVTAESTPQLDDQDAYAVRVQLRLECRPEIHVSLVSTAEAVIDRASSRVHPYADFRPGDVVHRFRI